MRSDEQIINQTNAIARIIYSGMGYTVSDEFKFYTETKNRHPHEVNCWNSACKIQELMTSTDPNDALCNLEE